ncbi:hypothetical protein [Fervidibacillus halotolerans]|uniref:Uncharacterized protein n=1 Tax=Fervidibacillus halotolerans TaxID=2980027 RepID=A0A9E8M0L9_9BACI|nr:hypothetical protein [Fervidibacillus halotolerans]WAA13225.1 hypothetical protein OE105_03625 [Fervidibacillus halotolerans]
MKKYEMIILPNRSGIVKVYIYNFLQSKGRVKVYASLNEKVVSCTGYNKKRTIIKALSKLYKRTVNQE